MSFRVFLVGHTISPHRGSESGNTWNWAWELSQHVPVHVLAHPHYRNEVEGHLAEHPNRRLRISWVDLEGWDPWRPERGERGIRLHYLFWLRQVRRSLEGIAKESTSLPAIVHHVSWNTLSAPPPFTGLGWPVVWGPVGGGQVAPSAFRELFGQQWPKELLRTWRVRLLSSSPFWRRQVQGYDLVLATNRETASALSRAGAEEVELFLDCGVPQGFGLPAPPEPRHPEELILLWAGRLESIKALPLALRALGRVRVPVKLLVAGDGPRAKDWKEEVQSLGLGGKVDFLGRVPWEGMVGLFRCAHALLFTSLRDSFGCVVLEAMAFGLPVIVPNHQGVGTFVPENAGIKVPVTTPQATVEAIAQAIECLASSDLRHRLAVGAWRFAQEERWNRRAERMLRLYERLLERPHQRSSGF